MDYMVTIYSSLTLGIIQIHMGDDESLLQVADVVGKGCPCYVCVPRIPAGNFTYSHEN